VPVHVEKEGKAIPKEGLDDLKELEVVVEENRVTLKEAGEVNRGWHITFTLDPARTPKTIDLSVGVEDFRPRTWLGIYKLDGDTLKICIVPPEREPERPTAFETKPGSKLLLWQFKRKS
jgi:uncharacterized protein (TIGR03067 family)